MVAANTVRGEAPIVLEPVPDHTTVDLTDAELEALPDEIFHKRRGRVLLKSRPRNIETLARRIARARSGKRTATPARPRARARAIRRIR
jgi:hypothetical protein